MSTFILVHGAWHGAWCWYKILPRSRKRGTEQLRLTSPAWAETERPCLKSRCKATSIASARHRPTTRRGNSCRAQSGRDCHLADCRAAAGKGRNLVYLAAFLLPGGQALLSGRRRPGHSFSRISSSTKAGLHDGEGRSLPGSDVRRLLGRRRRTGYLTV